MSLAVHAGAQRPIEMQFPIEVPAEEISQLREKLRREDVENYIVVSPGGGWKSKCWPPERFGALCAAVWRRYGIRSVINIAPGEEPLGEAVVGNSLPAKPGVHCPALPELVALMSEALLVVGGDTGPLHLAAALGTHVVALFGPTNPRPEWALTGRRGHTELFLAATQLPARRLCSRTRLFSEMLSISVDQVLTAVEQEMARTSLAHSPR